MMSTDSGVAGPSAAADDSGVWDTAGRLGGLATPHAYVEIVEVLKAATLSLGRGGNLFFSDIGTILSQNKINRGGGKLTSFLERLPLAAAQLEIFGGAIRLAPGYVHLPPPAPTAHALLQPSRLPTQHEAAGRPGSRVIQALVAAAAAVTGNKKELSHGAIGILLAKLHVDRGPGKIGDFLKAMPGLATHFTFSKSSITLVTKAILPPRPPTFSPAAPLVPQSAPPVPPPTYAYAAATPVESDLVLTFTAQGRPAYRTVGPSDSSSPVASDSSPGPSDSSPGADPDLASLLSCFPIALAAAVRAASASSHSALVEIALDLGSDLELRYADDTRSHLAVAAPPPGGPSQVRALLDHLALSMPGGVERLTTDNRLGLDGTLHRISVIRSRLGAPVGLTCRVGRGGVQSAAALLQDVLDRLVPPTALTPAEAGGPDAALAAAARLPASLLVLGPPGCGKTTLLREMARDLAGPRGLRVIVVDSSNEIGGDGDVPHAAIGRARRMQIPVGRSQADIMIEAVQNHNPQVLIIDEVGTPAEVAACKTIAQRGVSLVATAHGASLSSLLRNPPLAPLVGGVTAVTLGDAAARQTARPGGDGGPGLRKTRMERGGAACFGVLVELAARGTVRLYRSSETAVDALFAADRASSELRWFAPPGMRARFCARAAGAGAGDDDEWATWAQAMGAAAARGGT